MGAFYGTIYLRTEDDASIRRALEEMAGAGNRRFYLAPAIRGWTAVYPHDRGQDPEDAAELAERFPNLEIFYVTVHDDDLLTYTYYRDGQVVDRYNNIPDYFGPVDAAEMAAWQGHPEKLLPLLPDAGQLPQLKRILSGARWMKRVPFPLLLLGLLLVRLLRLGWMAGMMASEYYLRLTELLRLPNPLAVYEDLEREQQEAERAAAANTPLQRDLDMPIERREAFLHIPRSDPPETDERTGDLPVFPEAGTDRLARGQLFLGEIRTDLPPNLTRAPFPQVLPAAAGTLLLCGMGESLRARRRVCRFAPPWNAAPQPAGLELPGQAVLLALLPHDEVLVAAGDAVVQRWGMSGRLISEERYDAPVVRTAASEDGRFLAVRTWEQLAITDVATGKRSVIEMKRGFHDPITLVPGEPLLLAMVEHCLCLYRMDTGEQVKALALGERMTSVMRFPGHPARTVPERIGRYAWSADGTRLICLTTRGIRVFTREALLAAEGELPPPAASLLDEMGGRPGQTFSLQHLAGLPTAFDPQDRCVLAALRNSIYSVDLATGRHSELLAVPELAQILRLVVTADGTALCVLGKPGQEELGHARVSMLQLWNYGALTERMQNWQGWEW